MKYLLIFAIIITFSYKLIEAKTKQEAINLCVRKLNVSQTEYFTAKRNNFNGVSRKIQCLVNCVFEDLGLSNNGVIQDAKLQQLILSKNDITAPVVKEMITNCKKEMTQNKSTDKCFNANAFRQCIRKNKHLNANSNSRSAGRVENGVGRPNGTNRPGVSRRPSRPGNQN